MENWCRNTQSVRNKVIDKNYVFSVTSRSRIFRFGRNKELALTNKQKQFCKKLLFPRDTRRNVSCAIENRQLCGTLSKAFEKSSRIISIWLLFAALLVRGPTYNPTVR